MTYMRVLTNWTSGLWGLHQLKQAYAKGIITKEQYRFIKSIPQSGTEATE